MCNKIKKQLMLSRCLNTQINITWRKPLLRRPHFKDLIFKFCMNCNSTVDPLLFFRALRNLWNASNPKRVKSKLWEIVYVQGICRFEKLREFAKNVSLVQCSGDQKWIGKKGPARKASSKLKSRHHVGQVRMCIRNFDKAIPAVFLVRRVMSASLIIRKLMGIIFGTLPSRWWTGKIDVLHPIGILIGSRQVVAVSHKRSIPVILLSTA